MDVIGLKEHEFLIPVDTQVTIGNAVYEKAMFICRLLTIQEIKHIDKWTGVINDIMHEGKELDLEDDWFFIARGIVDNQKLVVEEEVFHRCFIGTVGIDTSVDMNTIEAGVISQIGQAILRRSLDLYISFADYVEKFQDQKQSYFDMMKSLLCRYQNETMENLDGMPIDKLLRRFAMLRAAFPKETELVSKDADDVD